MALIHRNSTKMLLKRTKSCNCRRFIGNRGTIEAVAKLVELAGGEVVTLDFAIELKGLKEEKSYLNMILCH